MWERESLIRRRTSSSFRLNQGYILVDHFDTSCVISHRIERKYPLLGMSNDSLMLGGQLINMKSVNSYPIYRVRHVDLFYCMRIHDLGNVPRRRPMCRRLSSHSNLIRSCSAHPIYIEMSSFQSLRSVVLTFNVFLYYEF